MSAQVAQDLRAAAEVLRRDGWAQHAYHHRLSALGTYCHCAEGAVEAAAGSWVIDENGIGGWTFEPLAMDREEAALEALRAHLLSCGVDPESIPDWNDADGRTADEVIAALEAAADAAEAQQ
jgi:hypothetical protein